MPTPPEARTPLPVGHDEGVSPVIGMILVLAISVVGIAGILYWGMPTIEEMKANVELKSMLSQFRSLLADIQELDAGTAGKTAKRWQPTLQRGELLIQDTTERWAFTVDRKTTLPKTWDFTWAGIDDADHIIHVRNGDGPATGNAMTDANKLKIKAYTLSGTYSLAIRVCESAATPCSATPTWTVPWNAGDVRTLYLRDGTTGVNPIELEDKNIRIEIWYDNKLVGQAWILSIGHARYRLDAGVGEKEILITNGALMQGTNGNYVLLNSPPIPPPKTSAGVYRFFGRIVEFDGNHSAAGSDRFDVLVNLYGTHALADIECNPSGSTTDTCATRIKMYPLGPKKEIWSAYYLAAANGYSFERKTNDAALGSPALFYLEDSETTAGMSVTLIHSTLTISG